MIDLTKATDRRQQGDMLRHTIANPVRSLFMESFSLFVLLGTFVAILLGLFFAQPFARFFSRFTRTVRDFTFFLFRKTLAFIRGRFDVDAASARPGAAFRAMVVTVVFAFLGFFSFTFYTVVFHFFGGGSAFSFFGGA